jgi:phenylalanyl-tRNA synthetase beta chain
VLFSYNWLKEYTDTELSPVDLSERLTMSGIEVEGSTVAAPSIKGVVTAEILAIDKHPGADKLKLCDVKTDKERCSIVCGASNMKVGDRVALALPGAQLRGGVKIKKSKIRGVTSGGMMCSEVELGLADTSEGIMILPVDAPLGMDINEYLGLTDTLMEVAVLPNRPDILSTRGLAREISAVTGSKFLDKELEVKGRGVPSVPVSIEAPELCRRYTARVIEGVTVGATPDWMKRRLESLGVRSINNVVDVTNYVMLEMGQPLHGFDLERLEGRTIRVRTATQGETIETIDNVVRKLEEGMLVISDAKGPVAIAGVMGGNESLVREDTKNILLESAWFEPSAVRRTSRKLGLSTDSSYRFERGVDIEGVVKALNYSARLIADVAGGRVLKGMVDVYPVKFVSERVRFRIKRASALLGIELEEGCVKDIFKRLGIGFKASRKKGVLETVPPSFRLDIKEEVDLVEEVARLVGYDTVPASLPAAATAPARAGKAFELRKRLRDLLVNSGFLEVVNYSFVSDATFRLTGPEDKTGVTLLNPLTEEQVVMRESLLPSLMETLRLNLLRKNEDIRMFELRPVFLTRRGLPDERWKVGGLMYGLRWVEAWNSPREPLDFYDVKGVVERLMEGLGFGGYAEVSQEAHNPYFHPGKGASLTLRGKEVGFFGELHPDIQERFELKSPAFVFELDISSIVDLIDEAKVYRALAKYPESTRDIAFIVDEDIPCGEIIRSIQGVDTKFIENVMLFDVYYGGNIPRDKRSMAFRIVYRSREGTLKYHEVEEIHSRVAKTMAERFDAEIRKG